MKLLMNGMRQLRDQEAFLAEKIHGPTFPSFPEGYTALAEEVQEAQDEIVKVNADLSYLLRFHRDEAPKKQQMEDLLYHMEQTALQAACELVQVAYVAGKMARSLEGWK